MQLFLFMFLQLILIIRCEKDVYAILLSTSKFWFNYRQGANSLIVYNRLRDNGIKDSNILVQLPENIACNPRNNDPGIVSCYDGKSYPNLYVNPVVDYRHTDVSVETLLNVIRGRYPANIPQSKRLNLNEKSRLLIYVNGHGGNGYLKMQDTHVVSTEDFAKALRELHQKQMYSEVLAISDSCEAATLFYGIDVPNVFAIGSSTKGQKSLSHGKDNHLNLAKTDKFTFITNEFLQSTYQRNRKVNLAEMIKIYTREFLEEDYEIINTFTKKNEKNILVSDFFSSARPKQILFGKLDIQNMDLQEQKFVEDTAKFMQFEENNNSNDNSTIIGNKVLNLEAETIKLWQLQNARTVIIQ